MNSLPMLNIIAQAVTPYNAHARMLLKSKNLLKQKQLENVEEPPKSQKLTPQPLCSTERRMS